MLVIRLFRIGKKNQPSFKIVVTDKRRSSTRGRSVEELGHWNPKTKERVLKQERIKYWLSVGAQPSATVFNLLVSGKIIEGKKKIDVHKKPKKLKEDKSSSLPSPSKEGSEKKEKPAEVPPAATVAAAAPAEKPVEPATVPEVKEEKPVPEVAAEKEKPLGHSPEARPTGEAAEEKPKEKLEVGKPAETKPEEKK